MLVPPLSTTQAWAGLWECQDPIWKLGMQDAIRAFFEIPQDLQAPCKSCRYCTKQIFRKIKSAFMNGTTLGNKLQKYYFARKRIRHSETHRMHKETSPLHSSFTAVVLWNNPFAPVISADGGAYNLKYSISAYPTLICLWYGYLMNQMLNGPLCKSANALVSGRRALKGVSSCDSVI